MKKKEWGMLYCQCKRLFHCVLKSVCKAIVFVDALNIGSCHSPDSFKGGLCWSLCRPDLISMDSMEECIHQKWGFSFWSTIKSLHIDSGIDHRKFFYKMKELDKRLWEAPNSSTLLLIKILSKKHYSYFLPEENKPWK